LKLSLLLSDEVFIIKEVVISFRICVGQQSLRANHTSVKSFIHSFR
jgi:hypothetical protein